MSNARARSLAAVCVPAVSARRHPAASSARSACAVSNGSVRMLVVPDPQKLRHRSRWRLGVVPERGAREGLAVDRERERPPGRDVAEHRMRGGSFAAPNAESPGNRRWRRRRARVAGWNPPPPARRSAGCPRSRARSASWLSTRLSAASGSCAKRHTTSRIGGRAPIVLSATRRTYSAALPFGDAVRPAPHQMRDGRVGRPAVPWHLGPDVARQHADMVRRVVTAPRQTAGRTGRAPSSNPRPSR